MASKIEGCCDLKMAEFTALRTALHLAILRGIHQVKVIRDAACVIASALGDDDYSTKALNICLTFVLYWLPCLFVIFARLVEMQISSPMISRSLLRTIILF